MSGTTSNSGGASSIRANYTTAWRELVSQPRYWRDLASHPASTARLWQEVRTTDEVVVFGSGSSLYLAGTVGQAIERITGRRVNLQPSCEIILDPDWSVPPSQGRRVAIGYSRSGKSSEVLTATEILRGRDIPVLGMTCAPGSSLSKVASDCVVVAEGNEEGVVMLRSFTSMLLASLLALGPDAVGVPASGVSDALERLASSGDRLLQNSGAIFDLADSRPFDRFVFLGSGDDFPLAQEAALKLQEMAAATTEAYYTLEYRHGPRATGDTNTLATIFAPTLPKYGVGLVEDLSRQGIATFVISGDPSAYTGAATATLATDAGLPRSLQQVLALLPIHLLAFATATRRGQNPDAPRNLDPVVRI